MAIAVFGSKVFEVSWKKIYTMSDISVEYALSVEEQDVEGKKPNTYIKGEALIPFNFTIHLDSRFVDIEQEIDSWKNILSGRTPYPLSIGGKLISNNRFLMVKMAQEKPVLNRNGEYLSVDLKIELKEYSDTGKKKASSGSNGSSKKKSTKSEKSDLDSLNLSADAIKVIQSGKK